MRAPISIATLMCVPSTSNWTLYQLLTKRTYAFVSSRRYQQRWIHKTSSHKQLTLSATVVNDQYYSFSPSVEARMQELVNHPAVVWNTNSTFTSMHKKKLAPRHLAMFDRSLETNNHDDLFEEFAKAVCNAGVVARKEVFETWACALYIHEYFLQRRESNRNILRRVADIAAGHGLLAFALLILDDDERKRGGEDTPLTAFCLDVKMPKSAELIQLSMFQKFPHLEKQFDYVEGRLEQLIPHDSCLLVGVHACGTLSDVLVSIAAEHGVSLALVPCCHSRKAKVLRECASHFATQEYEAILNTKGTIPDLADRLDRARIVALKNSGMVVKEAMIPNIFTDKNRLIMATPSTVHNTFVSGLSTKQPSGIRDVPIHRMKKVQMPPLNAVQDEISVFMVNPKARFMKRFYVPCKDDNESHAIVSQIAGRLAAVRRKEVMHNRYHNETPHLDISLWLPANESIVSEQSMSELIKSAHPHIQCSVSKLGDVYTNPAGRRAQTFRIQYELVDGVVSFEEAHEVHKFLYQNIPTSFPGTECR